MDSITKLRRVFEDVIGNMEEEIDQKDFMINLICHEVNDIIKIAGINENTAINNLSSLEETLLKIKLIKSHLKTQQNG